MVNAGLGLPFRPEECGQLQMLQWCVLALPEEYTALCDATVAQLRRV